MPSAELHDPLDVLAISGSLRRQSSNTGLIRLAQRLSSADLSGAPGASPPQRALRLSSDFDIGSLPFYDADLEDAPPEAVVAWRRRVTECDGLFIATPEYNFGTTAVLKNAIDWVTRPPGQHALRGKVISIMSSSASTGGKNVIEYYTNVLPLLGNTMVSEPDGGFVKGSERIGADGSTTDPEVESRVLMRLQRLGEALQT